MYPVTNDYKNAIAKNARVHKISGYVDGHSFDGDDVIRDSFSVKNQLCPATAIQLGGVYIGECDLVFSKVYAESLNIRGSWKGKVITVTISVEAVVNDEQTFIDIPCGVFTIETATWNDRGLSIVAYDDMSKFDKPLQFDQSSGTVYGFASYICNECDVDLGMTEEECEALPNGSMILGIYPGSSMQTFRDVLSQLAVAVCCYATINRDGALEFRRLTDYSDVTDTVSDKVRYSTSFSDYTSYYTDLEVENMSDGTASIYSNSNIGGLTLNIGANPFLQYGTSETVNQMRQAIIDGLQEFRSTPFKVSVLPNPAYDLGDLIRFTGGIGQGALGCVMSLVHKVNSTTIEGYGENPAAAGAQSSVEKQLVAQAKNQKSDGLTYYTFTNASPVSLNTTAKRLYRINFATADKTTVDLWHEVKWNVEITDNEPVEITYEYYLDGVKFDYEPVDRFGFDGYDTRPHPFWLLEVSGGEMHTWEVKAKLNSGSAVASMGDIHAELRGQKLVGQARFNGNLELADEYTPWSRNRSIVALAGAVIDLDTQTPISAGTISQGYTAWTRNRSIVALADSPILTAQAVQYTRVTEDGEYTRTTEDGSERITEV